jgi:hypothetical protein
VRKPKRWFMVALVLRHRPAAPAGALVSSARRRSAPPRGLHLMIVPLQNCVAPENLQAALSMRGKPSTR